MLLAPLPSPALPTHVSARSPMVAAPRAAAPQWTWSGDLGAWTWGDTHDLRLTPPAYRSSAAFTASLAAARATTARAAAVYATHLREIARQSAVDPRWFDVRTWLTAPRAW